jgi:hypothetical protein
MSGPQTLIDSQGPWPSRMGKAFVGTRAVFRGHDLHTELKDLDWMALYVLGITGKRFSDAQIKLMHAVWVYTSYPDPRIWNNRVAALAGTTRSTANLAMSAACAVSEATIYGRGIDIRAADFLSRTQAALERGDALAESIQSELSFFRSIAGYGRPIAAADERIAPMMVLVRSLGLDGGQYLRLAFEIERHLLEGRWRWRMNYGAMAAALSLDLGLSPYEHYQLHFGSFLAGMQPCFIEASERPPGTLFPLACEQVLYDGAAKRDWPMSHGG